jgi:YD repeat-containing protein
MQRRLVWLTATTVGLVISFVGLPQIPAVAAPGASNPITYVYDEIGRLEAVIDPTAATNGIAKYAYDDVGNLISITRQGTANTTVIDFHGKTGQVGTPVTIYGAGFDATPTNNVVKFGGTNGTTATITSASQTILKVTVPSGASTGPIYVKNNVSKKTFTTTTSYTVVGNRLPTISTFTPKGDATGSTACSSGAVFTATISGTNFETTPALNNVLMNGFRAQVATATATSLTINTPPFATAGRVTVATPNGQVTSSGDYSLAPDGYCSTKLEGAGRITSGTAKTVTVAIAETSASRSSTVPTASACTSM